MQSFKIVYCQQDLQCKCFHLNYLPGQQASTVKSQTGQTHIKISWAIVLLVILNLNCIDNIQTLSMWLQRRSFAQDLLLWWGVEGESRSDSRLLAALKRDHLPSHCFPSTQSNLTVHYPTRAKNVLMLVLCWSESKPERRNEMHIKDTWGRRRRGKPTLSIFNLYRVIKCLSHKSQHTNLTSIDTNILHMNLENMPLWQRLPHRDCFLVENDVNNYRTLHHSKQNDFISFFNETQLKSFLIVRMFFSKWLFSY